MNLSDWWSRPKPDYDPKLKNLRNCALARLRPQVKKGNITQGEYERYKAWSFSKLKEYNGTPHLAEEFKRVIDFEHGEYPYHTLPKSALVKRMDHCIRCQGSMTQLVPVFEGDDRGKAIEDGFIIPLCDKCYKVWTEAPNYREAWMSVSQECYEMHKGTHEEWMERYGENFIVTELQKKRMRQFQREREKNEADTAETDS